jgi:hypothetical protein
MDARRTVAVLLCLLWSGSAIALDSIGPPKAQLKQGQIGGGFGYSFSSEDVGTDYKVLGVPFKDTIKDVESSRYYGTFALGVTDYLEVFGRIGSADMDPDDKDWQINGDSGIAWGYGLRATFVEQEKWSFGGVAQMHWINSEYEEAVPLLGSGKFDYDGWELQIAVGPTIDMGGWYLYGGPFYYVLDGSFDAKLAGVKVASGDVEEESNFGGFIGAHFPIGENFCIGVDYAMTGDGYVVGAGVGLKF